MSLLFLTRNFLLCSAMTRKSFPVIFSASALAASNSGS
jgi:hypothetical protein